MLSAHSCWPPSLCLSSQYSCLCVQDMASEALEHAAPGFVASLPDSLQHLTPEALLHGDVVAALAVGPPVFTNLQLHRLLDQVGCCCSGLLMTPACTPLPLHICHNRSVLHEHEQQDTQPACFSCPQSLQALQSSSGLTCGGSAQTRSFQLAVQQQARLTATLAAAGPKSGTGRGKAAPARASGALLALSVPVRVDTSTTQLRQRPSSAPGSGDIRCCPAAAERLLLACVMHWVSSLINVRKGPGRVGSTCQEAQELQHRICQL